MEQRDIKIYKFNIGKYKKHNLKRIIATIVIVTIIYFALILAMHSSLYFHFLIYFTAIAFSILIITNVIKEFIAYSRADKTHKNDSITIYKEDNQIVSVDIKMQETKYDEFYSIKTITQLHRKNYIDVEGVIHCMYNENSSDDATNLRIPPYFENMDEIYEALEEMKEQA